MMIIQIIGGFSNGEPTFRAKEALAKMDSRQQTSINIQKCRLKRPQNYAYSIS